MQEDNKNKKSFHQNMKAELKKVIWPTGKQVVKSTFATIGFVLLISIILVALNSVFSFLNSKWVDLVLDDDNNANKQNEQIIDVSGDSEISNEEIQEESGEVSEDVVIESGDSINSGDENNIIE
jgi:preprotein translocase subunit SecE